MGETEGGKAVFEGSEAEWDGWKGRKRRVARLGSDWDRTVLLVEAYTHVEEHALADVVDAEVLEGNAHYQDVVAIVL